MCVKQHVVIKYYSQALLVVVLSLALPIAKGWTNTVHRQDKHDFSLIMIEFKLFSTLQDGNQLGSLSYLPRVRIERRGSEKPINLTEQLFIERFLTIY